MNPFLETRSPWPARTGACCAALITLMVALVAFFVFLPPVFVRPDAVPVSLYLPGLTEELWRIAARADCGTGLAGVVAVDCRAVAVWHAVSEPAVAAALLPCAVLTVLAVIVAGWMTLDRIGIETPGRDGLAHIRGRRLQQDAGARRSLRRHLAGIGQAQIKNLWLVPHVQLPSAAESYNILAIGTQGAGKTGLLRAWLEQLIERGDRIVVHDVKGDMTAGLPASHMILVAPHDARSAAWDIARDIGDRAAALEFATRSIKAAAGDSMWAEGARALWADAIVSLVVEHGRNWTLRHLYHLLTSPPEAFRAALVEGGAASAELIAFDDDGGVQRTSMSLLITLWVAALTTLKPLVDAWENVPAGKRFSLTEWLGDDTRLPATIVIQKSAEYPELSALVGGLLVERLVGLALAPARKRNPAKKIALVLDELAELGRLHRLPNLLSVGREVGVVTIAAVQDLGQLTAIYGETVARSLEARFGIKIVGRLTAGDTAERISKVLVGDRLIEFFDPRPGGANGTDIPQRRRETHPVFPPERMETELGVRRFRRKALIRCLVLGLGDPALLDVPFTAWPERRPAHRPAAWTRKRPVRRAVPDRNDGTDSGDP